MDSATYKVSFSTTSKAIGGLNTNYLDNIGADNTEFGQFNLSGSMPDVLTLTGNTFNYKPLVGNLLMTVEVLGLTETGGYQSFFQADSTGLKTGRLFGHNDYTGKDSYGLVTQFNEAKTVPDPTSVPEPTSTLALLGLAALGTGSISKRKQQQKATVRA
ncbi:PEP-CTERM sorting domain-containing protein [Coleofasciculus sp. FACHB-129]|nr:PEP-CTERM sorting domain-containing protein [Coleofasciculus sp. FACHB-129]